MIREARYILIDQAALRASDSTANRAVCDPKASFLMCDSFASLSLRTSASKTNNRSIHQIVTRATRTAKIGTAHWLAVAGPRNLNIRVFYVGWATCPAL
jgi:hypothetical protein